MLNKEWPAEDYAIGSVIQETYSDIYFKDVELKGNEQVLDIGCGDGRYSRKIIDKLSSGHFTGIDASQNMLNLAQRTLSAYPNITLQEVDAASMEFKEKFDWVFSFWCLQWTKDIKAVFEKIYAALKQEGKLLVIFPVGDDVFIRCYKAVKDSGEFPILNDFKLPINLEQLQQEKLEAKLTRIPFTELHIAIKHHDLELPSLDIFKRFVYGVSFYQRQIPDEQIKLINDAMVKAFEKYCQENYQNKLVFSCRFYCITGKK